MAQIFNFDRLIRKYSVNCKLISEAADGRYIGGEWVPEPAPPSQGITGAVIPMMDRKIYQSGGTYTEQDREFITLVEIPLEPTHYIIHHGSKYEIQENTDYSGYAGFYAYNLKRVSAFDRSGKDQHLPG